MLVENCRLIRFPKIVDSRGTLTCIESEQHVPFSVKRVFYLYDVPRGQTRGAHAHKELHQVLVCLAGSFDVIVEDGRTENRFHLDQPSIGLYIPPLIWDTEVDFAAGTVCMVLASDHYDESDYYRDYGGYLRAVRTARESAEALTLVASQHNP
jgi:dTDP-4-dehydrorhamnose 3,5-epimerase-like enzyme